MPLHLAFQASLMRASLETAAQELKLVRLLVEAGARVTLKDKSGEGALHAWAGGGHVHATTLRYLLKVGADINAQDHQGRSDDQGDAHELVFSGVAREDIVRVDYLATKR